MSETLALARRYVDLDRPESALEVLERARGEDLEDTEFWAIRAKSLPQLERSSESAEAAENGLEHDPEDVELLDLLALAHLQADRYGEASRVLTKALELAPDEPILLAHKALASARLGAFEVAQELIARAMRVAPDSVPVLRTRAQVAFLASAERAFEYVDELLEADPEDEAGRPAESLDLKGLAKRTALFSGADLAALVERAVDRVTDEALDTGGEPPLRQEHLVAALDEMRPTTLE
ncbi:MAG TPA: tetratricopeptide repeat protein [Gaiellaceae bacterium]|nr:tetratricopeptide repeat protein [Gaiellaceae bacterium]